MGGVMIDTIYNYKLKEFFQQEPELIREYVNLLKWMEPIETKNQVFDLKLKDVDFIRTYISEGDDELIEIVSRVQGITKEETLEMDINTFFGLFNSIKEQIEVIVNNEVNHLSPSTPNLKWEAVNGSERMQRFGIYNTLDKLSDGDILKWESILELPYSDVFVKLLMEKTKDDLNNEMQKINTKANV